VSTNPEQIDRESWDHVLDAARAELERQYAKWGRQDHPDGTGADSRPLIAAKIRGGFSTAAELMEVQRSYNDTIAAVVPADLTWTDILLEETFEAFAEPPASAALYVELIQTAAVALQWASALIRTSEMGISEGGDAGGRPAEAAGGTVG
jgi:hypothetical protein